ncbi:MAG: hypothetical protein COU06_01180 [Candidatus Harrisonbacteria bacterium CG10_big_fil_rev_8_21_14_0_10_38_8]|uniref:PrgI family protein n=1 Tax=Candidatus Harrisonbacteria bacterium CG10_big_fil_rev_8_21_14_0_10_38_8 TaxID=1974582 RepID=A0A2M6WKA3_9BACT|nr:MAG: hypothetical protein COU06_01180 [Candidatus Harrisonbacteria bacterium CG10_big_fil_rev_8_21_14_0_10_38_8]
MQFQVPQFIDIEDKIVGPLTLKQFLYLSGAGGFGFILFFIVDFKIWIAMTVFLALLASSFAFLKINGRTFPLMFLAILKYLWTPKFYIWKNVTVENKKRDSLPVIKPIKITSEAQSNPLKNLLFKMKTHTVAIAKREKQIPKKVGVA